MLVFIDDSGDPGFKLDKGSSPFFVIACVIFDDELEAEKAALAIKVLRRELKFSDDHEFKFYKCHPNHKKAFFEAVKDIKFRVRAIRVDKSKITSPTLRSRKDKFYNYTIKMALQHSNGTIVNSKIKLDGTADRTYRQQASTYLLRELNSPESKMISSIRFVKSHTNMLIQLADMVAGAINRDGQKDKKDAQICLQMLRKSKKIESLWDFPGK